MKRLTVLFILALFCLGISACTGKEPPAQIAATTLPVYDFTQKLCADTDLRVERIISQEISCLHDYTLQINQMQAMEGAQVLVLSGAGLEEGLLPEGLRPQIIDASAHISLLCPEEEHKHDHDHDHIHAHDPHIWLSPENARQMAVNICEGLSKEYPVYKDTFFRNLAALEEEFDSLEKYAKDMLSGLTCRKLVTFHDGFSYMANAWDLVLLHAVEEESGSEASARELEQLCELVTANDLPAIFTEKSGSVSAAEIISAETGIPSFQLDMAMSGDSYFTAMYHNIDVLKEALG